MGPVFPAAGFSEVAVYLALARNLVTRDIDGMAQQRLRVPWISFGILLFMVTLNLVALISVVPTFQRLFEDNLPGKLLPGATIFVINYRYLLAMVAMVWLIVNGIMLWRQYPRSIVFINCGIACTFLQVAVLIFALLLPMFSEPIGIGDQNH